MVTEHSDFGISGKMCIANIQKIALKPGPHRIEPRAEKHRQMW